MHLHNTHKANIFYHSKSSNESKNLKHKQGSTVLSDAFSLTEEEVIVFGMMLMIFICYL